MANTSGFNSDLDKITEREVVYDFVSRLKFGKDLTNTIEHNAAQRVIVSAGEKLKDLICRIIMMMPSYVINNIVGLRVASLEIPVGSTSAAISQPSGKTLLRAISETTGQDITDCFTLSGSTYTITVAASYTSEDTVKMYFA